jgi:hypothetical protein
MVSHPNRGRKPRPLIHLENLGKRYSEHWHQIDDFRQSKGKDLPDWPEWCFMPMAAWIAIASQGGSVGLNEVSEAQELAAVGAWRYTQSIYRLDDTLYDAVKETIPKGDLPIDVFYQLPEWSLYIETPNLIWLDSNLSGFWVHLEFDINTQRHELRFLLDTEDGFVAVPLHLGKWTITEAVDRAVDESVKQANIANFDFDKSMDVVAAISESLYSLVSLTLYVCSEGVEYSGESVPSNPSPKRTKKDWRLFPAAKPRVWNLGKKTGDSIRQAADSVHVGPGKKAPHIRRAHWHNYWVGSGDDKMIKVKWLPPMLVAMPE